MQNMNSAVIIRALSE